MRARAGILIVILTMLFLVGTATANYPDSITIITNKSYLTANGVDQATLTVTVSNSTAGYSGPIAGARIDFTILDTTFGNMSSSTTTTDINGKATGIFRVKTKSGLADIRVDVTTPDGFFNSGTITQKIDHDKPAKIIFIPPYEGTVGTTVAFNTSFTDYWGNPIDNVINPNEVHKVNLHVHGPAPDDCNFVGFGHDLIGAVLDANGNVPVQIKLTTVTGYNYVSMEAFDLYPQPKVINAIAGTPFYIEQIWNPSGTPPKLPADASFTFVYSVYDKFRNPAGGQNVWINTTSGNNQLVKSQENGNIQGTYTESVTGFYTVSATSVANSSVTISQTVQFYNATATSHNVLANPQTMPSRDVNSGIFSNISAKVVDQGGNGVANETVTFSISDITYTPSTVGNTSEPSFSPSGTVTTITTTTLSDGTAMVFFYPGAFVTSGPTYSQSATGNCKITATWNGIPKIVDVSWKNYAYLSAVLTVSPPQVKAGDTVDVNLKLNGDGWNLARKPIDVVLIIDRSGSMAGSRISQAKNAANTFVDAMSNNTNNRVGLVSFASTTSKDQSLTNSFSTVKSKINLLSAVGATQMRQALYEAITDLDDNGRSDAVKAVILLTDGDWNYDGTPLATGNGFPSSTTGLVWPGNVANFDSYEYYSTLGGGTSHTHNVPVPDGSHLSGSVYVADYVTRNVLHYSAETTAQNMSVYAVQNGIRLYALSFVDQPSVAVRNALTVMTTSTGDSGKNGFYQHAPDEAALENLYAQIATQLQEDAGVDTTSYMDFGQIIVDDSLTGSPYFDYVADPVTAGINPGNSYSKAPGSTMVDKYNKTTKLPPGPDFTLTGPWIVNQTAEWMANRALYFNIGVVKLGETWETNFRLRMLRDGPATVFLSSPNSTVHFKDDKGVESVLTLKNLSYLTVLRNTSGISIQNIDVNLVCPALDPNATPVLPITWTTTYTGNETDIFEELRYGTESGAQVPFYQTSYHVTGDATKTSTTDFDMRRVASGVYNIYVHVYTPSSEATSIPRCGPYEFSTAGKTFIYLK